LGEPIHASFLELIQYQRVTGEGEVRLGLQRLTTEFTEQLAAGRPARGIALLSGAARKAAQTPSIFQTNLNHNRPHCEADERGDAH